MSNDGEVDEFRASVLESTLCGAVVYTIGFGWSFFDTLQVLDYASRWLLVARHTFRRAWLNDAASVTPLQFRRNSVPQTQPPLLVKRHVGPMEEK